MGHAHGVRSRAWGCLSPEPLGQLGLKVKHVVEGYALSHLGVAKFHTYVAPHDLQEPLRKISAFAGLIQYSLQGKLDEDQKENLEFMVDGAQRMQMMVDALLYYSRVATTTQPRESVDLNELIQELRNSELASLLDETEGAIHVPEPLPLAHGDPLQIRQLLQNLIGNGLKFHREGVPSEIIIRALAPRHAIHR